MKYLVQTQPNGTQKVFNVEILSDGKVEKWPIDYILWYDKGESSIEDGIYEMDHFEDVIVAAKYVAEGEDLPVFNDRFKRLKK